MKKYICTICGFIYDEAVGIPESGIAPETKWESLDEGWTCPLCSAQKENFEVQLEVAEEVQAEETKPKQNDEPLGDLLDGEISALFSNLAKGAHKQYLEEESTLFEELANYYKRKTSEVPDDSFERIMLNIKKDLDINYPNANRIAKNDGDRGAQRALLWTEKVTRILSSVLSRYEKEGNQLLEDQKIHVCDICGFVYIGDNVPKVCPVCKVPNFKIIEIRR